MMKDTKFTIYNELYVYLGGEIRDGSLQLVSEVFGNDYDSEKHYDFSVYQTEKLFSLISFEDFIENCRNGHLLWMESFLRQNGITPATFVY